MTLIPSKSQSFAAFSFSLLALDACFHGILHLCVLNSQSADTFNIALTELTPKCKVLRPNWIWSSIVRKGRSWLNWDCRWWQNGHLCVLGQLVSTFLTLPSIYLQKNSISCYFYIIYPIQKLKLIPAGTGAWWPH